MGVGSGSRCVERDAALLTFPSSCRGWCGGYAEAGSGETSVDEVGFSLDVAHAAADGSDEVVAVGEDNIGGGGTPE